jgi:hypothetical protein
MCQVAGILLPAYRYRPVLPSRSASSTESRLGPSNHILWLAWETILENGIAVDKSPLQSSWRCAGHLSVMAFYEKVIKVKADVAAFLINCFPFHLSIGITLRW